MSQLRYRQAAAHLLVVLAASVLASAARLPYSGVRPQAYSVKLRPHFDRECSFAGQTEITLNVENTTDEIVLHARNLRIDDSKVSLVPLSGHHPIDINKIEEDDTNSDKDMYDGQNITFSYGEGESKHILRISLSNPLEPPSQYILRIGYNGSMNSAKSNGIYCRKYKENNETRWFMSTTFEPYLARSAFPCFDEPAYKAPFTITILHPKEYTALSNMPAASIKPIEGEEGQLETRFEKTPPISTYLVGFFLGKFLSREVSLPDNHTIRIWASSAEKLEMGDLPLAYARRHYQYLLNYTGLPDPVPKTDLLAIRHYHAGGLENWGIISLEERLVLLDSKTRSRKSNLLRASSLLAHELAHIWFGNLVTPAYWDDIWLSEGFATFFASKATHDMYPTYGFDVQSWVLSRLSAMSADSLPTAHPLKVPVGDHPTGDLFDEITYHKGDLMVRMLSLLYGEEALQRSMRRYLSERKFGTASDGRLWEILESEVEEPAMRGLLPANVSLAQVMRSWTEIPGYPVITVRRNYNTSEVTFSQRSILENEGEAGGWWIPISYTCTEERNFTANPKFWLSPYSGPITVNITVPKDHWLLVNTRGAGYYTVHYDTRNSLLLADDLESLPLLERIQVFGDILELGRLGQSPVELSLDVLVHFSVETNPAPWFIFLASVPKYMNLFKSTSIENNFKTMIQNIMEPEMNKLTNESPHRKQVIKLSCKLGIKNCTDMALEMYEEWKNNKTNRLPDDVQYTVFCTAVAAGNKSTWDYLMERYKASENHKEKKDILKALACTTDKELTTRYLTWALEKNKTKENKDGKKVGTMLKALAEKDPALVLNALNKQHPIPAKMGRNMRWKKVLEHVALQVNSEEQLNQLKKIVEEEKSSKLKFAEGRGGRCRIVEIAENNIAWLKENQEKAEGWFKKQSVKV